MEQKSKADADRRMGETLNMTSTCQLEERPQWDHWIIVVSKWAMLSIAVATTTSPVKSPVNHQHAGCWGSMAVAGT